MSSECIHLPLHESKYLDRTYNIGSTCRTIAGYRAVWRSSGLVQDLKTEVWWFESEPCHSFLGGKARYAHNYVGSSFPQISSHLMCSL